MSRLLAAILACAPVGFGSGCGDDGGAIPTSFALRGTCEVIGDRFGATMGTATGRCETAADCGCFSPVVSEAGCGGVTDAPTARALRDIERTFHEADCDWPRQCAPWACQPVCEEGRCANGGGGGSVLP